MAEELGGYIAVVDKAGIKEAKQYWLKWIVSEYIDEIEGEELQAYLMRNLNKYKVEGYLICQDNRHIKGFEYYQKIA